MSWFTRTGGIRRRDFLRAGFGSIAVGASEFLGRAPAWAQAAAAQAARHDRILVVVELSGGNDGLNTVVPYGDDAYYRARPRIGIKPARLRKLDDHFPSNTRWRALSASTRTDSSRSCTASVTLSRRSPISLRWLIGRPRRQTAATSTA